MLIEDFYHDAGLDWSVATSALLRKNRLKRAQIVLAHPEGGEQGGYLNHSNRVKQLSTSPEVPRLSDLWSVGTTLV